MNISSCLAIAWLFIAVGDAFFGSGQNAVTAAATASILGGVGEIIQRLKSL